jgi:hypothetical protein
VKRLYLLILAVLLLGIAWYLVASSGPPDALSDSNSEARVGSDPDGLASEGPPDAVAKRRAGIDAEGSRTEIAKSRVGVTGRCVDAKTKAPLRGCAITVYDYENWSPAYAHTNTVEWHATSGADGRFVCEIEGANAAGVTVYARMDGRVGTRRPSLALDAAKWTDVGDLELVRGCRVRGLVVDTKGTSIAKYTVQLSGKHWEQTQTAQDGTFAFPTVVQPGKWNIQGLRDARRVKSDTTITVESGRLDYFHRFVVEAIDRGKTISGTVVDAAGAPVEGYWLGCMNEAGAQIAYGNTGKDGSFFLFSSLGKRGELATVVSTDFNGRGLVGGTRREVAWGTTDLRLVMKNRFVGRTNVQLTVLDGDTGEPVEAYRFRFYCQDAYQNAELPRYIVGGNVYGAGRHVDGKVTIEGAMAGAHMLSVLPANGDLAPSGLQRLDVRVGADIEHTVTLFRRRPVSVEVRSRSGKPVVGTNVQLILYEGKGEFPYAGHAWPVETVFDRAPRTQGLVYSEARTDANGNVTLTGRPAQKPYVLRLMGPGHVPVVHAGVKLDKEPVTVRVTVDRGGTLIGRFLPLSAWQSYWPKKAELASAGNPQARARLQPGVILVELDKRTFWPLGHSPALTFDRDGGTLKAVGVPPGRYKVRVTCRRKGLMVARNLDPEFTIAGEEVKNVDVEMEPIVAAKLSGTVYLNGAPLADAQLFLRRPVPTWNHGYLEYPPRSSEIHDIISTDAKGRFPSMTLFPGTYTVAIQNLISADSVKIGGEEERDHAFHIRKVKLRVIVRSSTGELVANRRYELGHKMKGGRIGTRAKGITDANGQLTLDPAPAAEFYLSFFEGRKARSPTLDVGPLRAPLDRYEDVIEVQLPAPK